MNSLKAAPPVSSLELTRMRRDVKAKLFGTPQEPIRIGRYRVRGTLGHGGMGIVYLAQDEDLGREVAIKLLRSEFGSDGGRRLNSEAKSLARLSHPHVVAVFDVGEHEGQRFIAMEYVQGETLGLWLERTHELDQVLDVFLQAGEGLAAAHAVGLVHRDFKPDNVLVGVDGRARVLDFGLARPPDPCTSATQFQGLVPAVAEVDPLATSLTRDGALLGTPAYMAPEQHLGDPAGPRSDQFAFGIALHDAVYGHRPFLGEDLRTLSLSIVAGKRQPVSTAGPFGPVPQAVVAVIDRALSIDPEARFESMQVLMQALKSARSAPDGARPSSSSGPASAAMSAPNELETQAFEAALGIDQRDASGLPVLHRGELAAVAEEVGLEVQAVQLNDVEPGDALAQRHAGLAKAGRQVPRKDALAGDTPVVVLNRELRGGVHPADAPALGRVLERAFGMPGRHEMIGRTYVWSSDAGEVTLAPHVHGSTLVLEQRLLDAPARRKRRLRSWGAVGFVFAFIIANIAELMQHEEPVAFFLMFIFTAMGVGAGALVDRRGRKRAMAEGRERLALIADRIGALVVANPSHPSPLGVAQPVEAGRR